MSTSIHKKLDQSVTLTGQIQMTITKNKLKNSFFYEKKKVLEAPKELQDILLDTRVESIEHEPDADLNTEPYIYKLWVAYGYQVDEEQHCIDADNLECLKSQMERITKCKCESCLEGLA
jgi:hypothetical protein